MSRKGVTHDVFISHSSQDREVAEAARAAIEGSGHRCWIAPRDIVPGQKYGEAIVDGIHASRIFLLIVSSQSVASHQVERETERAASAGLAIIPFRIEDVKPSKSLEFFISSAHWLDAFEPPMERHYSYLTEVVGQLLAAETDAPAPARTTARVQRQPAPRPFWRRPVILAALAAILAAAGGGLWWLLRGPPASASCVSGDYVQRATATDDRKPLNMRVAPSLESRVAAVIDPGESFCVGARQGEWWPARRRTGETGFVYGPRISLIVSPAPGNAQQPANAAAPAQENRQ